MAGDDILPGCQRFVQTVRSGDWHRDRALIAAQLPPLVFVSADDRLNAIAAAEGLTVDDPNLHP